MARFDGLGAVFLGTLVFVGGACSDPSSGDAEGRDPTWHGGVHSLLVENCSSCHSQAGIGPFALDDYETAKSVAALVVEATQSGEMPPWGAHDTDECAPPLPWQGDRRLSEVDKQLLVDWAEAGAPLGDVESARPVAEPPSVALEGDIEMAFSSAFEVSGEADLFECFVLDPGNTEDIWITGVQVTPGNRKVDHHAIVFLDPDAKSEALATDGHFPCFSNPDIDGSVIGAWAPGAVPFTMPPTSGIPMPAGARLVVQMHYHPVPGVEMDRSSVSITTRDTKPKWEAILALLGNFNSQEEDGSGLQPGMNDDNGVEFRIPAGASDHVETLVFAENDTDLKLPIFGVGAHMHYVGRSMKIDVKRENGDEECLLHTPDWDFDWQRIYNYDADIESLPTVSRGDEIVMRCNYDNSMNNPAVVDAITQQGLTQPIDVFLGDETLDEMCLGVFGALAPPGTF